MVIRRMTPNKAIAALERYGGTVIKMSLSDEDAKMLQTALDRASIVRGEEATG